MRTVRFESKVHNTSGHNPHAPLIHQRTGRQQLLYAGYMRLMTTCHWTNCHVTCRRPLTCFPPDLPPVGPPLPILSRLPFLPGPLPDTCRPLPEGWVQVSPFNSFGILGAYNPQCIATNARVNPGGSMCDGEGTSAQPWALRRTRQRPDCTGICDWAHRTTYSLSGMTQT